MSQINVNNIRAKDGVGAVGFPGGIQVTGVATATTFSGNLTGNVTGNADTATIADGLQNTPNIVVGSVTGTTASFSGNVSVGGTLTYEDVTNIDSVGLVTARSGIKVTSGGASFVGSLTERAVVSATAINSNANCNIDDGLVHYRTANLGSTANTVYLTSNVGVNTIMATGDIMNFTVIHAVNSSSSYINNLRIEGVDQTESWVGGSAPTDGGTSGVDIYSFTIITVRCCRLL